jgi:putative MATE family efflux protein
VTVARRRAEVTGTEVTGDTHPLVQGAITPTLIRFALPLLTTNLLHALSSTWGAIWVSHVLGADALTAVVTANLFMFMMMGVALGIGTASGVAIGQSIGAEDLASVTRVVGTSIGFVMLLAIGIAISGIVFAPQIIALMNVPEPAREHALSFLRYTCLSLPSLFTYFVMLMMLRNTGDAKTPFRFTLLWIALGLVLAPALLTGALGLPRLGIAGVAIGNLIANATALGAMTLYIYVKRLPLALRGADMRYLLPDPKLLAVLIRRGLPMALETLIIQGSYFTLMALVNSYGAVTAAGYAGAAQLWTYVQLPSNALAASMSAMAAINIGAQRWDRVEKIALRGCLLSLSCACAATLLILGLDDLALRLFIPQGGEVLSLARTVNQNALWGWIGLSISLGLSAVVRANGAMLAPTLIFAVTMWVFRVPFAVLLQPLFGAFAIWWSFPFGSVTSALLAYGYYRWGGWRKNKRLLAEVTDYPIQGRIGE